MAGVKRLDITVKERLSVRPKRLRGRRLTWVRQPDGSHKRDWMPVYTIGEPYEVRGVQVFAVDGVYSRSGSRLSKRIPKRLQRILHRPGIRSDNRDVVIDVVKTILDARLR
jgi:hypothetical protein